MTNFELNQNLDPRPGGCPRLSTADLFEMASLDALGLLDENERRSFEDAFAAAPASIKSQVRAQQSRMADIDAFLPRVDPPASLRGRVLAAVQAAIDSLPGRRVHEAGRTTPQFLPSRGVNPMWRAIAIGFAAAVTFLSVTVFQMFESSRQMESAFRTGAIMDTFKEKFGQRFRSALTNPTTKFVKFTPGTVNNHPSVAQAILLMDESKQSGMFFCYDLPNQTGEYAIVSIAPDGTHSAPIVRFQASGGTNSDPEMPHISLPPGSRLAVTAVSADPHPEPVLTSDSL